MDDIRPSRFFSGKQPHGRVYFAVAVLAMAALGNLQLPIRTFLMLARATTLPNRLNIFSSSIRSRR